MEIFINRTDDWNQYYISDFTAGWYDQFGQFQTDGQFSQLCDEIVGTFGSQAEIVGGIFQNDTLYIDWIDQANGIVGTSQLTLIRIEGGGPGMVELRPPDDIELGLGSSTTVVLNWEYYDINDSQQTISADQAFENESRIQSVNDSRSPEPEADHTLGIDKFIIQRSVGDETNYADYAEVGGDTTVFFDNNELDGQLYFYRVYASINDTLSYPSIENCIEHKAPLFDPVVNTNFTQTPGTARGASWVDYNNDGFDDIVIYGLSNNEVYENNGDGSFEFKENALTRDRFITSFNAAWADYDNDGFIDVYVPGIAAAEGSVEEASDKLFRNLGGGAFEEVNQAFFSQSKTQYTPIWIDLENDGNIDLITGNQGIIYHNNGDGTFTAGDTLATLMADGSFITLSPRVVDVDSDGDMDISVNPNNTNDAYTLFINDGFGQFTTSTIDAIFGDFVPFKTSIGQSWADYDNDGDQDLFIGDFVTALYENLGNLQFERIPVEQLVPGVIADELITDSYYTWADFDNDGWKDIIWNFRDDGNRVLLNNRNKTFRLLPEEEQLFEFTEATKSISVSDFNNDGYPDFFLGSSDPEEPNQLFKANPGTNNWIKIRLQGVTSNRSGLGTQVRVKSAGQWQYDQANNYNGRGAGNGMALIFGLGTATVVDSIVVDWPSGDATVVTGTASNQILTISERIPVSQSDSLALVSLYESTGGATDWLSQGGWLELPAREWQGTFFNEEGRLTGLVLGNNNLTGKIPVEVTTLDQLEAFDLANNQLEGIIPDSLNRMIALRSINLSNNNLSGGIPLKIGEIPGLVNINFSNNQLQGLLPSSINDLSGLVELNLANNQMIGFLPAQIGGLTELLILNLGNNDFEGTIPISFGNLSKVEELALNNNDLTGRIPGTFGNLNPVIFDAAGNALSGTLPNGLSNWSRVDVINLAENDLTGSLQSIVALDSVSQIFVNDNRFRQLPEVLVSRLDTISAINNWLDFEAFEANELLSGELIALDPQDSLFRKRDTLHQVGVPIEFQYPIGGSANVYQWFKDGLAIDGATDSLISLQTPDFDDEGFYHLQVTSTLVPDVTLTTNTIELKLTSLARDRAALTAFFNATNTPADPANRWINSTNWDSNESLDTWDGVDVANDRVIRLSLPNNNIDGFVPDIFAELNGLQEINLAGNELRSFPDVSDFESLTILRLDSNRLGFADLLPHREVTGFEYSPQRRFDRTVTDTIPAGENYVLEVNMEGEGNVFTWYFQSLQDVIEDIPAEPALDGNSPKYLVNEIDFFDMGVYYAEVTNPDLPDLTIRSRNRNVFAKTEIFGRIVDQDSISLTRGEITLFRQLPRGPYDSTSTVAINGAGEYGFEAAVLGNFILRVVPDLLDTTDFLQTYYIQQNDWLQADTLKLRDRTEGIDIVMISNPGADFDPGLGGTGRISGTLEADLTEEDIVGEDSTARVEARRRVRRAGCSLSKRRSSGRPLEDIYDLVAYTETDDEGKFSFGFIPDGEYRINIQYPGVPMDSTTAIDFVVGAGGTVEDNEFTLEATITEEGIQVDVLEELGRLKPFLKNVKLYPNPTEGRLVMDYLVYRKIADLSATLHTASGKVMLEQQLDHRLGSKQVVIDMEAFESGFYFLTLTDEAKTFKHTIKVTKK
ncbi:MAG: VCBS repeat-containing protein [Cyclobacteriaceae bacterium]|nr:VCBS repeat-containing protein [Cyclobacteriaceae bacterium HetDA_MAG_MS6]